MFVSVHTHPQRDGRSRLVEATGDAQVARLRKARCSDQAIRAQAFDRQQAWLILKQFFRCVGDSTAAMPADQPSATRIGPCGKPRRVRIGTSGIQRVQPLTTGKLRHLACGTVVREPIADQQVFLHIGLRPPIGERTRAVVHGVVQRLAQRGPVAALDRECARRFGDIAQAGQTHFAIADSGEIAIQHRKLAINVALVRRGRAVPQQTDHLRHDARHRNTRKRHFGMEIMLAIAFLHEYLRLPGGFKVQRQSIARNIRMPIDLHGVAIAITPERDIAESANDTRCIALPARDHMHWERSQTTRECERQLQSPTIGGALQRLVDTDADMPLAIGGDRIHTQAELVARRLFQQARIDTAALDRFKYHAPFFLFDRHRRAHATGDIERKPADLLAWLQWKLQLAFKRASVGVVERHLDRGARKTAIDLGGQRQRLHVDRSFSAIDDQQRRRDEIAGGLRRRGRWQDDGDRGGQQRGREHGMQFHDEPFPDWTMRDANAAVAAMGLSR